MNELEIPIKLLHPDAKVPTKKTQWDAGWDLYSCENTRIYSSYVANDNMYHGDVTRVHTGISVNIPKGYVGLIWDRSGLSINRGIHRVAGVIDSGYIGEIVVGLINFGEFTYDVKVGDRIAQMVIQEIPNFVSFKEVDSLEETERGDSGFGSSGR